MKKLKKVERNPAVMAVAIIILIAGLILTTLGFVAFSPDMWVFWSGVILLGMSCVSFATLTIITGQREWILIHLIFPW